MRAISIALAATLFALAGAANAHPKLLSANPSPNTTVTKPSRVTLRFSEKLIPAFSKADLTMAAMPGRAARTMPSSTALAADGRTLIVTPKGKLSAGRYSVGWHVVSTDTHKVAGSYAFAVK